MILVIDNYDSFIYNIVQYVGEYYTDIKVFRNDEITLDQVLALDPAGIIISPGPGRPEDSRVSMDLIKNSGDIPLLGVCLGHQGICLGYGGEVIGAKTIMHGKSSAVKHNGKGIFEGLPNPVNAIRYHSLAAKRENLPEVLEITAETDDGEIMGVQLKGKDVFGVQFHPESILTESGKMIIKNFVNLVSKRRETHITEKMAGRVKTTLTIVSENKNLSRKEAREMMEAIISGTTPHSQIAGYLTAMKMKGESAEEIAGSADAMFAACVQAKAPSVNAVDTCGSGGDKSGTFNISTASSFVTAGAGATVAKHGNRSITSKSGAADVLEKLGVHIQPGRAIVEKSMAEAGIGFFFAPVYHPGMKHVMPVRKDLGFRTLFNILGPIVNPAGVKRHVMGVFSKQLLGLIPQVFVQLGHVHSMVIFGEGGIDEASIEGTTFIKEIKNGDITDVELRAADYGLDGKLDSIRVNSPEESAELILAVLEGRNKGDARKAVVLNAGLALACAQDLEFKDAFRAAELSIDSGKAYEALSRCIAVSNGR